MTNETAMPLKINLSWHGSEKLILVATPKNDFKTFA